jgi:hypothetical protein
MTTETDLVLALWRFIENSGTTEEFFDLRERVRQHGALSATSLCLMHPLLPLIGPFIRLPSTITGLCRSRLSCQCSELLSFTVSVPDPPRTNRSL